MALVRVQIFMDEEERAALRANAERLHVSISEVVRRQLRPLVEHEPGSDDPLLAMIGKYASPEGSPTNVAERHDTYLYGAEMRA